MLASPRLIALAVAAAAFVALLGSSVIFYSRWQSEESRRIEIEQMAKLNAESAKTCSDSVANLQDAAKVNSDIAATAIEAARNRALSAEKRAQKILGTAPSTPGNDCKSASDRVDSWLNAR